MKLGRKSSNMAQEEQKYCVVKPKAKLFGYIVLSEPHYKAIERYIQDLEIDVDYLVDRLKILEKP